ncbi:hypothetical protein WR164_05630 [Philodulcilactobacillus myokoensis]|uniref:Uncharacterized protein n=1 Tax=Philodulcilactobacillus myokoensis TaxID=2929573 RepID=A0A9W6ESX3_9LACO|nr:hypothetical protein [Philodulcilactobacillus myokoensis]GLB46584.1 hypothetical protein WR164_05630 [Philodulcilactobacillus myokoensis]
MSEELLDFAKLSDEAKNTAVSDFASFYFNLYSQNGLELITSFDQKEVMNDINNYLLMHQNEDQKEIVKASIKDCFAQFSELINQIDQKFYANGNSEKPWNDWYNEKFVKLGRG